MGASSKGFVAVVAATVVVAGGWWFGVRHDVGVLDGPLAVGGGEIGFDQRANPVSVGIQPCIESGSATVDAVRIEMIGGGVELLGVLTKSLDMTDGSAVGAVDGFPPSDDMYDGVVWQPLDEPLVVESTCDAQSGRVELVVGLRSEQGGAVRLIVDYTKNLARYSATDEAMTVVLCGPALEGLDEFVGMCGS